VRRGCTLSGNVSHITVAILPAFQKERSGKQGALGLCIEHQSAVYSENFETGVSPTPNAFCFERTQYIQSDSVVFFFQRTSDGVALSHISPFLGCLSFVILLAARR
jgi:hypothetical protein